MGLCLSCFGSKTKSSSATTDHLQCAENPPVLDPSSGQGSFSNDFGLRSYVSGSVDSKAAVLLIPDVFGCEAPLLRKLADKVASAGFFVVVPDFFDGKPFDPNAGPLMEWLNEHPADKGFDAAKPVVETLRNKGFSSIGAAGFCWGAKVVADLAKHDYIKAAVMLHPSFVTADDIKEVKCHIAILGAEHDHITPPALVKQFEEILALKEVNSYVKIYSGVSHGWSVRYESSDERACQRAEEAHTEMIDWFTKYLK